MGKICFGKICISFRIWLSILTGLVCIQCSRDWGGKHSLEPTESVCNIAEEPSEIYAFKELRVIFKGNAQKNPKGKNSLEENKPSNGLL